jgi:putative aldouronate transport system substrate-binding protein
MQYVPAAPAFDDLTAEDTTLLQGALGDAYAVWNDAFIRGTRDIDADWDTYVQEMKDKGMDEYLALFNQFSRYQ